MQTLITLLRGTDPIDLSSILGKTRFATVESLVKYLIDGLSGNSSETKCHAAEALCRIDAEVHLPKILLLLRDPDVEVRYFVCGLALDWGDSQYCSRFAAILCNDTEPEVRVIAADFLARFGGNESIPLLQKAIETDTGIDAVGRSVRSAAMEAG